MPPKEAPIWRMPGAVDRLKTLLSVDKLSLARTAAVLSAEFTPITKRVVLTKVTRMKQEEGSVQVKDITKAVFGFMSLKFGGSPKPVKYNKRLMRMIDDVNETHSRSSVEDVQAALDNLFGPRVPMPVSARIDTPKTGCNWIYGNVRNGGHAEYCGRLIIIDPDEATKYCDYHLIMSRATYWNRVAATARRVPSSVTGLSG